MNSVFYLKEKFQKSWAKKDSEDEILMMGYLLMRKRRNHQQQKLVREIFLLYHSLSFVATQCHSLYHSLSLVTNRCTTFLFFYKRSFLYCFMKLKSLPNFVCSFIFDGSTSKVADVSAVFLWSQWSYENIIRIISKRFDIILMRINE